MKTAVQWLKEQYIDRGETIPSGVFQEALEKEKEQIIDAAKSCNYIGGATNIEAEEYYNQTYNQNK
jgi:hypothetical protein